MRSVFPRVEKYWTCGMFVMRDAEPEPEPAAEPDEREKGNPE
jgi:hypothetical protein